MLGGDSNDQPTGKKPKIKLPDDFDSEAEFLDAMRKDFYDDIQYDRLNREAALEDLRFAVGDQWDDIARQRRESARKPVLTVNRIPAFVAQIVGNRRLNETSIKVIPDNGGTAVIARVREDLMRSIQKISRAKLAFDSALQNCVICGIGNFQVVLDYTPNDVWTQEIRIEQLPDPLAVVWDREIFDPTGADAKHVNVVSTMRKQDFYKQWPWATPADMVVDTVLRGDLRMNGWISVDDVRIVNNWRLRTRKRTLALMNNGATQDITDDNKPETLANIVQRADGSPIMREVQVKYAQMYVCSGLDILEGPYELPISRVPVFRVPGWEVYVGQWKHRWGLTRFMKDPQRLHNFWRSVVAEKIMQTPRAVWLAAASAVAGREKDFRQSHLVDDPLLIYNDETGQKPERVPPAQLEESLIGQAELTTQDLKDVSNIHEANLGMPSNEVSGAAIMARQRVSDTGTIIYNDNLTDAIEQCGMVINELIPIVYDTPRIVKVIGDDAKQALQVINDPNNPESVDLTLGKYSVSVVEGASTATKRIEAAEHMMTLINAMPQVASSIADLIVSAQDWPMAEEIARRLRLLLPPGMLDPKDMSPQQQQVQQAGQAQQQQSQQMALRAAVADYMKTQSEIALNTARAHNFEAAADAGQQRANIEQANAASEAAQRELAGNLDVVRAAHGG